jgi:hypothetical protein
VTVVSLSKARKARAKADDKARAAENRVAFGRTRAEKDLADARREKAARALDAKKREP